MGRVGLHIELGEKGSAVFVFQGCSGLLESLAGSALAAGQAKGAAETGGESQSFLEDTIHEISSLGSWASV